jgi:DNA-binding NarL/FixJ family response regulator
LGAAAGLRDSTGVTGSRTRRTDVTAAIDVTRQRLSRDAFAAAWAEGRALSFDEAVALAASATVARLVPRPPRGSALTRREREVATLVARGLTNAQIADALVISPGTARIHVERILGKLGLTSRVQIATWVVREDASAQPRLAIADR